jgi:hypothetical protein
MKGCEQEIVYKVSVSNGWTECFKTKCGWYSDGEKKYCKDCLTLEEI